MEDINVYSQGLHDYGEAAKGEIKGCVAELTLNREKAKVLFHVGIRSITIQETVVRALALVLDEIRVLEGGVPLGDLSHLHSIRRLE